MSSEKLLNFCQLIDLSNDTKNIFSNKKKYSVNKHVKNHLQ